jgi:hypothetical protein
LLTVALQTRALSGPTIVAKMRATQSVKETVTYG